MTVEKKTIRSDIPGHHTMNGTIGFAGSSQEEGRRLIVGRDITLNGDIASCDHLVVEGTVHAQSFGARRVDILEAGFFAGSCEVQDAIIAGRIEGKLKVHGRLTVKATGRIYGEVEYGIIEAEAGAKIEGHVKAFTPVAAVESIPGADLNINDNTNVEKLFDGSSEEETLEERPRVFRRTAGY